MTKPQRCETTLTMRYPVECNCGAVGSGIGPCVHWEAGANPERCVYCDHVQACHHKAAAWLEEHAPVSETREIVPEHVERVAALVEHGEVMTARDRALAAAIIRYVATPHELRTLGTAMLTASDRMLRWHAEKLASRLGCSGPYKTGDAMPKEQAND